MYDITIEAVAKKPIFGYGINSTYVEDKLTFGNPQNGLLKMLLDYGIIGTAAFMALCYNSLKSNSKENKVDLKRIPLLAFLYGMMICSLVEINLAGIFYLGCAITKSVLNYETEKSKGELEV